MCKKENKTKTRISGCPVTELTLRQKQQAGFHSLKHLKCHTLGWMEAPSPLRTVDSLLYFFFSYLHFIPLSGSPSSKHVAWQFQQQSLYGAARGTILHSISQKHAQSETSPAARSPVGCWCPRSHPQPSCARAAAAVGISPPQAAVFAPEVLQNGVTEKVLKLHF